MNKSEIANRINQPIEKSMPFSRMLDCQLMLSITRQSKLKA
jgi:hypothetical protein